MRKVAVLSLLLLTLLLVPHVQAGNPDVFMGKFIDAFNTGNYSLIEPYMSGELKSQFTEGYFHQIGEFTLSNYGKLRGYELISNSTEGELRKFEYRVYGDRGSFPVLLAYKNGKLVGIALGIRAKPNPVGMLLMMLGSLIPLGVFYYWRRRLETAEFVMGVGIALGLSVILPFYSIVTIGMSRAVGVLTTAFLTALTVEGSKYYFSHNRDGLSLGLGFGVGKYVFLAIGTFVAANFIMKLPVSFAGGELYTFLSALVFTAFHGVSAMLYSGGKPSYFFLFTSFEFSALALLSLGMPALGIGLIVLAFVVGFALTGGREHGVA
ncbi:DUF3887 domain-containing protein [Thermococcus sp.]|uniref:DUF3887 domain-containing protein n=1 Tax=Thermococcus sp. TaxID=35749 RepID=UPI00262D7F5A|nr:DUF3887 domain-containing protein [Thermococcus sp.]